MMSNSTAWRQKRRQARRWKWRAVKVLEIEPVSGRDREMGGSNEREIAGIQSCHWSQRLHSSPARPCSLAASNMRGQQPEEWDERGLMVRRWGTDQFNASAVISLITLPLRRNGFHLAATSAAGTQVEYVIFVGSNYRSYGKFDSDLHAEYSTMYHVTVSCCVLTVFKQFDSIIFSGLSTHWKR